MSLPSDVTPDIPPPSEPRTRDIPRGLNRMTPGEQGWVVAALVAFVGVAYLGPAIARYRRKPSLRERVARRWRATEQQTRKAGAKARRRARRLGGGSGWR